MPALALPEGGPASDASGAADAAAPPDAASLPRAELADLRTAHDPDDPRTTIYVGEIVNTGPSDLREAEVTFTFASAGFPGFPDRVHCYAWPVPVPPAGKRPCVVAHRDEDRFGRPTVAVTRLEVYEPSFIYPIWDSRELRVENVTFALATTDVYTVKGDVVNTGDHQASLAGKATLREEGGRLAGAAPLVFEHKDLAARARSGFHAAVAVVPGALPGAVEATVAEWRESWRASFRTDALAVRDFHPVQDFPTQYEENQHGRHYAFRLVNVGDRPVITGRVVHALDAGGLWVATGELSSIVFPRLLLPGEELPLEVMLPHRTVFARVVATERLGERAPARIATPDVTDAKLQLQPREVLSSGLVIDANWLLVAKVTNAATVQAEQMHLDVSLYGADGAFVGTAAWGSHWVPPGKTELFEAPARVSATPRTFRFRAEAYQK